MRGFQEKLLVAILRLSGAATLLAFPTVLLPGEWMASTHRWLGLGEFPAAPVTDYMARSLSVLYGFHGVLMLLVSFDSAGMPWWWTVFEGPPIMLLGLLMLWLRRSLPQE